MYIVEIKLHYVHMLLVSRLKFNIVGESVLRHCAHPVLRHRACAFIYQVV